MLKEVLGLREVLEWGRRYNKRLLDIRVVSVAGLPREGSRQRNARADAVARAALHLGVWPHVFTEFHTGEGIYIYPSPQYMPQADVPALLAAVDCRGDEGLASCHELFRALREALGLPWPERLPYILKDWEAAPELLRNLPPVEEEPGEAERPEAVGRPGAERGEDLALRRSLERAAKLLAADVPPGLAERLALYVTEHGDAGEAAVNALLETPPDRALRALREAPAEAQPAAAAEGPRPQSGPAVPDWLAELWQRHGGRLAEARAAVEALLGRPSLFKLLEDPEALGALELLAADPAALQLVTGLADLRHRRPDAYRRLVEEALAVLKEL